jgi:hypothetical protein
VALGASWPGLGAAAASAVVAAPTPVVLQSAAGVIALTGPWRFAAGDNTQWARADYDDRGWETVDLTPKPHAHDADVGLAGYVPGWSARGHRGYSGYAWYRLAIDVRAPPRDLALAAPTLVDSAYQIYWDGRDIGGIGEFTKTPPTAYGVHPQMLTVRAVAPGRHLIAIRSWMDPAQVGSSEAGGLHVAPSLGAAPAVSALNHRQWLHTINGYVVDAIEPAAFLALALCALLARRPGEPRFALLAVALVLTALVRVNQPLFFWTSWESLHAYDALRNVIETPAALAAWAIAFQAWLAPRLSRITMPFAVGLGLALAISQLLSRSWFHLAGAAPLKPGLHAVASDLRLGFVALFALVLGSGVARRSWRASFIAALASALLISIGLFAEELSELHIKGVWFPFGVGVSRTQFAYAAAILTLAAMLITDHAPPKPHINLTNDSPAA